MQVEATELRDVIVLTPRRFADDRGWFSESWNRERCREAGISCGFVQDNHSYSARRGTLRGLHYQSPPKAQAKLVRVVRGAVRDIVVDVRAGSPDYGQWIAVELSAENSRQVFVPEGFLHGFITLEDETEVLYKCSEFYDPACDGSVWFDSASLSIDWGMPTSAITLSDKDRDAPDFSDWQSPFIGDVA